MEDGAKYRRSVNKLMEQLLRGQIWVTTRTMKVKGAATTLTIH